MPGSGDPFLEQLYLSLRDLISDQRRLILAVSGGADSMALMLGATRLSDRLNARLRVVTVDHGLQTRSQVEAKRVVTAARALKLPATVKRLKLGRGAGVEERARLARYAALEAERKRHRFAWVATAHTASDQAETLLMRLSRGAALRGAASIRERRDRVIRPLLFATRGEVRAWLSGQGVRWHEDPMNDDARLLRTRVRQQVLPALEAATDPRVTLRLARFARLAADDDALLQAQADAAFERLRRAPDRFDQRGWRRWKHRSPAGC
ncbi:MAG: tRNA lysidine(34) synthetase TilS [Archangiaceae bacterium]|nr:tRNA lysidine(34) synthetase TilS [Archangiaceae bacterium]